MKFGLSFLPDADPASKSASEYYRDIIDLSIMADDAGMETVKITEHHSGTYGGYCPDPLLFLTAVAQRTRKVRLLTGCILPVFHHPVLLAERIALADVLSGGRLELGFARAFLPSEFDMFEINMDESRERFEATIEAVEKLLTQSPYSVKTPFFEFTGVSITPNAIQTPHPPFWGAAARSRESFAWVAEKGYGLLTAFTVQRPEHLQSQISLYREIYQEKFGRPGKVTMLIPLFVAETQTKAKKAGEHYLKRYHAVWSKASETWQGRSSTAYPGYTNMAEVINSTTPEQMAANGSLVFGDPSSVKEQIALVKELFDVDQILWNVDYGAMPREDAIGSVRLFTEKVL